MGPSCLREGWGLLQAQSLQLSAPQLCISVPPFYEWDMGRGGSEREGRKGTDSLSTLGVEEAGARQSEDLQV